MTQLTDKHWAVEVPDDSTGHYFDARQSIGFQFRGELRFVHISPGSWQFICTTSKDVTEEQAKMVVEEVRLRGSIRYTDYQRVYMWHETARDSLRSLLTSKSLNPAKTYAIIQKL